MRNIKENGNGVGICLAIFHIILRGALREKSRAREVCENRKPQVGLVGIYSHRDILVCFLTFAMVTF